MQIADKGKHGESSKINIKSPDSDWPHCQKAQEAQHTSSLPESKPKGFTTRNFEDLRRCAVPKSDGNVKHPKTSGALPGPSASESPVLLAPSCQPSKKRESAPAPLMENEAVCFPFQRGFLVRRLWMTSVDTFKPLRTRSAGPFAGNRKPARKTGAGGGNCNKRSATTETQRDILEKMPGSYLEKHLAKALPSWRPNRRPRWWPRCPRRRTRCSE